MREVKTSKDFSFDLFTLTKMDNVTAAREKEKRRMQKSKKATVIWLTYCFFLFAFSVASARYIYDESTGENGVMEADCIIVNVDVGTQFTGRVEYYAKVKLQRQNDPSIVNVKKETFSNMHSAEEFKNTLEKIRHIKCFYKALNPRTTLTYTKSDSDLGPSNPRVYALAVCILMVLCITISYHIGILIDSLAHKLIKQYSHVKRHETV